MNARKMTAFVGALLGVSVGSQVTEAAGEFVWPINGWLSATTRYPGGADHQGASADIAAPMRTPIGASRAGSSSANWEGGGCGWYAWVTHSAGYITLYCHMVSAPARGGVGTNQTIGYVGMTGNTTGPHVHWAIRRYGTRLGVPGAYIGMRVSRGARVAGTYYGLTPTSGGATTSGASLAGSWCVWQDKVTSGPLNVRSSPSTSAARLGSLNTGTVVNVYATYGGGVWHKIWYGGKWAWIHGGYTVRVGTRVKVNTVGGVNVRSGPGTGYARVGGLNNGVYAAVFGTSNGWHKIFYGGQYRWIIAMYTVKA